MKPINNISKKFRYIFGVMIFAGFFFISNSCNPTLDMYRFDLPEAGSIADNTPPEANFTATVSSADWKTYQFSNQSTNATKYAWNFGDGATSSDLDATHTFSGEGDYTVTLTATDNLGVSSTYSSVVNVVEPSTPTAILPTINEAGFEDGSTACGTAADGRDCWRNSSLGAVIQITASPVYEGSQAAKFPNTADRIGYQELTVSPNTNYVLTYYYCLKTDTTGSLTVSVLAGGSHTNLATALAAKLADFKGTTQTGQYIQAILPFNSGANDKVSILITNEGVEGRVDSFSISL
ncbi:MAG: PKD domain-containing protein [Bergeyella sp.]